MILDYSVENLFMFNMLLLFLALMAFWLRKSVLLISFLQSVLMAIYLGLRGPDIGADTRAYIVEFNRGDGGYFSEKLFKFIGEKSYEMGIGYTGFFLIISLLTFLPICYANIRIFREEKQYYIPLVNWLMYSNSTVIMNAINGIRQGMAMAFIYLALSYIEEEGIGKKIVYVLLILTASEVHESAIIFLPLVIPKARDILKEINLKRFLFYSFSLALMYKVLFKVLSINDAFHDKMENYSKGSSSSLFFIKIVVAIAFFVVISELVKKDIVKGAYVYILFWIIMTISSPLASNRFFYYLGYLYAPLIVKYALVFNRTKRVGIPLVVLLNILYFLAIMNYSAMKMNFNIL